MKRRETSMWKQLIVALAVGAVLIGNAVAAENAEGDVVTLEQAQRLALERNPSMKNIGETVYQANVLIYRAWAILLPNLSASGSITRNSSEAVLAFPDFEAQPDANGDLPMIETVMMEKWAKTFGFTANMTLFNARSIPLLMNAYDNVDYSKMSGRQSRNDLLLAVAAAYFQGYSAEEALDVARRNLENDEEFLKLAQAKKEVGQGTKIDVLRAETALMDAEKELKNAEDAVELSKTALGYLIGIEDAFTITKPEPVEPVGGGLDAVVSKAIRDREDLKAARLARTMAERDRMETWTKWVPSLDVTYKWDWNSAAGFSGEKDNWMLIFGANWSILEGGGRIAELYERKSKERMAGNSADQLELDIKESVETNMLEMQKRRRNVELADKQIALAEETHRLITRQYELGMATSLDVTNASNDLSNVRRARILEQLQLDMAALMLNKAAGEYYEMSR